MKIILGNLLDQNFIELKNMQMKVRTTFAFKRWRNSLEPHIKAFNDTRKSIIEKHGLAEGMPIHDIPKDKMDAANAEIMELVKCEIDIEDFILSESDLDLEGNKVSEAMLNALSWLIKDNEITQNIGD